MDSWVTITGSSNGIGAALAEVFARNGYSIILHGRNQADLNHMCQKIQSSGQEAYSIVGDIRDFTTQKSLIDRSCEKDVGVFVNNVGYRCPGVGLEKLTDQQIEEMFAVNCTIPIKLTREMYTHFLAQRKGGCFMNMNSIRGLEPKGDRSIYAASRFAFRGFSESLRQEAEKHNVRILNVYAARIKTKSEFNYGWDVKEAVEKMYQLFAERSSDDLILDSSEKPLTEAKSYPLVGATYFISR